VEVTGPWLLLCYAGYVGCFLWSAAEALHRHHLARRRLALGLAEPVVVDRLLLWGIFGLAATGIVGANALGVLLGENLSTSPIVLLPMAVLGLAASAAVYLAFLPPAAYLRWIEARTRVWERASGHAPAR
jgi:predicted membrane chloride channel (bestrophin family)